MYKRKFQILIPIDIHTELKIIAIKQGVSMRQLLVEIATKWLKEQKE